MTIKEIAYELIVDGVGSGSIEYIEGIVAMTAALEAYQEESEEVDEAPITAEPEIEEPEEVEPEPEKPKRKTSHAKRKLDRGKIMACHNAGRSISWIADEMGCTYGAIWNIVKEESSK